LHLRKDRFRQEPAFAHPSFEHETRIVEARAGGLSVASIYVPNRGKDYQAKLRFLKAMEGTQRTRATPPARWGSAAT
jgi:exodeoxyribonuclease-3